jgi:transposase
MAKMRTVGSEIPKNRGKPTLYRSHMPKLFYDFYSRGLSVKLCAVKLGVSETALYEWFQDANKNGEESIYWELHQAREKANADRALVLMEKLEKAGQNRDPAQLRWMLNKCDAEFYDLDKTKEEKAQDATSQLTDAERLAAFTKFAALLKS